MKVRSVPLQRMAAALACALTAAAMLYFLGLRAEAADWARAESSLISDVRLIEDSIGLELAGTDTPKLRAHARALGQASGIRITLVLPDGTVVADSVANPMAMDNLAARPEMVSALSQEYGICHRYSPTLKVDSLFIARAVRHEGRLVGWIRASITDDSVQAAMDLKSWGLAVAACAAAAACGALIASGRMLRPGA